MGALIFKSKEVEQFILKLIDKKKILPYKIGQNTYHWLVNLMKHQTLDNPSAPKLPLPEWIQCNLKQYPSGKKYAEYMVIQEKLPVDYSSTTRNGVTNSNVTVTNSNVTESNKDIALVFNLWNERMPSKIREITKSRLAHLNERLKEKQFVDDFHTILTNILESDFLSGRKPSKGHEGWKADFDWVIKNDTNYIKILEGKYNGKEDRT